MDAHFNRFELENFSQSAAEAFLNGNCDLNETITKLARENGLTPDHIDRVVQNANIFVNGELVKRARAEGKDPRVSFPLANGEKVRNCLNEGVHKLAEMRKEAEVFDLFTVDPKEKVAHSDVLDATIGKLAPDPYADQPLSVGHVELARDMVKNAADAGELAKRVTAQTLGLACQTLESLEQQALTDHSLAKIAMDDVEGQLRSEINDHILSGNSPATIRDVIKHANLNERAAKFVDDLVTKVASELRVREGVSAFTDGSLVNPRHSLIEKSAEIMEVVSKAAQAKNGLDKFACAHKTARRHYAQAIREGR